MRNVFRRPARDYKKTTFPTGQRLTDDIERRMERELFKARARMI